jgi:hypothetical protein
MIPQHADYHEVVTFGDLQPLTVANGPCLSAVLSLNNPAEIDARLKNAIRGLRKKLEELAIDRRTCDDLLAPIQDLAAEVHAARVWAHALALFRSPSLFRYYLLHGPFEDTQAVGTRFQVRPLLQTLAHETRFHILALSRHHVRLLFCTQHRAELVETGTNIPENLDVWLNNRQPDHVLANRSTAGWSAGRMKGVLSGSSTDRERADQYLSHFFKAVDRGVNAQLRHDGGPLVLAGVEHEIALYQRVNSYRPTFEKPIIGSPDGLPENTLHTRAMEVVTGTFSEPLQRAMAHVRQYDGTSRQAVDPRAVVQAAYRGRVLDLLIAADAAYAGSWNEETQDVDTGSPADDLLNAAALETLWYGGRAFVVSPADMPVKAPATAILRF